MTYGIGHNNPPVDNFERVKDCHCFTCNRDYHHLGIARHRAMHREHEEDCKIIFSTGEIKKWRYASVKGETGSTPLTFKDKEDYYE